MSTTTVPKDSLGLRPLEDESIQPMDMGNGETQQQSLLTQAPVQHEPVNQPTVTPLSSSRTLALGVEADNGQEQNAVRRHSFEYDSQIGARPEQDQGRRQGHHEHISKHVVEGHQLGQHDRTERSYQHVRSFRHEHDYRPMSETQRNYHDGPESRHRSDREQEPSQAIENRVERGHICSPAQDLETTAASESLGVHNKNRGYDELNPHYTQGQDAEQESRYPNSEPQSRQGRPCGPYRAANTIPDEAHDYGDESRKGYEETPMDVHREARSSTTPGDDVYAVKMEEDEDTSTHKIDERQHSQSSPVDTEPPLQHRHHSEAESGSSYQRRPSTQSGLKHEAEESLSDAPPSKGNIRTKRDPPKKMPKVYPPRKPRMRPAAVVEPLTMTIRTDSALSTLASAAVAIKNHQGPLSTLSVPPLSPTIRTDDPSPQISEPTTALPSDPATSTDTSQSSRPSGRSSLNAHIPQDAGGYRCALCPGERFGRVHDLKRHQISKHNEMTWPCDFCHRPFVRRDALLRHYSVKAARRDGVHPTLQEENRLQEAKARAKLLS
ncbi:hypothetical protein BG011_007226 [Mortierella polycephala]|uniref:C2H2-type domain-containing protein n=1 Tax=Mortierella polycephala TaxID=41804 RepID=A0A9P6PSI6_9FUNG|nr:hypothetical protein BG011_007226 [Mortierella polycephala]